MIFYLVLTKFQDQPKQAHPLTDREPQASGSATTEPTGNPSGRISQSINSLRRKHPGISGRTVLTADSAQVKTKTNTYELRYTYIVQRTTCQKSSFQANSRGERLRVNRRNENSPRLMMPMTLTLTQT